jgi:hypothetical protein
MDCSHVVRSTCSKPGLACSGVHTVLVRSTHAFVSRASARKGLTSVRLAWMRGGHKLL